MDRRQFVISVGGAAALSRIAATAPDRRPPSERPSVKAAYAWLAAEQDRFHRDITVYKNRDSGDGHFFPSLWMGDIVGLPPKQAAELLNDRFTGQPGSPTRPFEGDTCIRIHYSKDLAEDGPQGWFAIAWRVLTNKCGELDSLDLRRWAPAGERVRLRFAARGERGGEQVEIKKHLQDDPQVFRLTREWKEYEMEYTVPELARPLTEGLVIACSRERNPAGCTFYLDGVRIVLGPRGAARRLQEPRFIRSYTTIGIADPDCYFRNACFSYDQALVLSALVARRTEEDLRRARLLADAFVYAISHDRRFDDGRIRNAYGCGDLAMQLGPSGDTRLPGWWVDKEQCWREDEYCVSSDTGNAAWVILGLLNYWEAVGRPARSPYLKTAQQLGEWIKKHTFSTTGAGGFTGGMEGFEGKQQSATWKSTEHAIDLYVAFTRLAAATGLRAFQRDAEHARTFVRSMINARAGHLWTGTLPDGESINTTPIPLDPQSWSLLGLRDVKTFTPAIDWACRNCRIDLGDGLLGFDFKRGHDGVWWEGTGQMAVALRFLGRDADADACLQALRRYGLAKEPRGAVLAANVARLSTGFRKPWGQWCYYQRPHLGATCWYLFAELGWNPYWNGPVRP